MSSFKIVQTIEKGRFVLCTVPESWEHQGILKWPKSKLQDKLRRDPCSVPEENWRSMNCIVKRQKIMSFEMAESELRAMSDLSDTDQEVFSPYILNSKSKNRPNTPDIFNDLARQCIETQIKINQHKDIDTKLGSEVSEFLRPVADKNKEVAQHVQVQANKITNNDPIENEFSEFLVFSTTDRNSDGPEILQQEQIQFKTYKRRNIAPETETFLPQEQFSIEPERQQESTVNLMPCNSELEQFSIEPEQQQASSKNTMPCNHEFLIATVKDLAANVSTIESKLDSFITRTCNDQITISENQQVIMLKLSEITAQFDEFIKRSSSSHLSNTENNITKLKTIRNEEGLIEFEELLKDKLIADEMTKTYSVICGEGKGRAINNAYALIDSMFDRNFLTKCSWAGGSRGENSKICFKSYKLTINFFFQIIYASDKQFTKLECESFLKNILRNAKKRCEAKQLKKSCQKKRQKKVTSGHKEICNENKKNESLIATDDEVEVQLSNEVIPNDKSGAF